MFWGLVLEPAKKYTQRVNQTFHISQVALDLKTTSGAGPVQLVLEYENSNFLLATLSQSANIFQVPLDLMFKVGDQVSFRVVGNGNLHLSGYHILEDLDSILEKGEEESDYDEEMEEIEDIKKKRKKIGIKTKSNKKAKLDNENEDEYDEQDDEEGDDDLDFDDDDDEDDDEEEEEESEEEAVPSKKKKQAKTVKQPNTSKLSPKEDMDDDFDEDDEDDDELEFEDDEDDEDDDDDDDDDEIDDSDEEKTKNFKGENKKTPNGIASGIVGKGKNLNKSKNEMKKQITPNKDKKSPNSEKKTEKQTKGFDAQSTPNKKNTENFKGGDKTPKGSGNAEKRVLEGGVICEDIKTGSGPVAKPGRLVNVYYVGTLSSTKKQFDSVQSGPGFKFRLGKNEVIKGWDIGVNGMKVGGTRRLTIPAHLAYGAKGSPPVIPPNSTLVFTVELKGIS